jgi:hypothetical protein
MSGPDTSDPAAVAVALAELRGTMQTGFATVNGSLQLLAQRGDQNDRRLEGVEARLDVIERGETEQQKRTATRLDALEASRWPWRTIGGLTGVAAAAAAVVGAITVLH